MTERKEAVLRKIRIIKMIAKGETGPKSNHQTDDSYVYSKRIEIILGEVNELKKIITESLK